MIFARDKGQMCNNILQYGHVYAWAREHGKKSISMRFCYKYPYFHIGATRCHNFLVYVLAKYTAKCGLMPVVEFHEKDEDKDKVAAKERLMLSAHNVVVEGWYLRFYDLFLKYRQDITNLFAFRPEILAKTKSYMASITTPGSLRLGVHIRRGDYKTWNGGRYYYDDEVYIDYIRKFSSMNPNKDICVFICGNDPEINKIRYISSLKNMKVDFPNGNPGEDLCLLSECDYIIGAPSTFSLVAAMYHDRPLMWIYNKVYSGDTLDFKKFDYLFKHIQ